MKKETEKVAKRSNRFWWQIVLLVMVVFVLVGAIGVMQPTTFDSTVWIRHLSGTATPILQVDQNETGSGRGVIAEFRDQSTPVARIDRNGITLITGTLIGELDLNGQSLTLDADADSTLTADTDDQVDIALGGADIFVLKDFGAATVIVTTTEHLLEIVDTTNVLSAGTNILSGLNIDLGIGNSTGGTNSVYGILIDDISADAQNTETAIGIGGSGWDVGLDLAANSLINVGAAGTDFSATGGLTLADGLTVTSGGATISAGTLTASGGLGLTPQTAVVTGSFVITPVSSYIILTSTLEVTSATSSPIITTSLGSLNVVFLVNENASDVIHLDASGSGVECGANIDMGAGDVVTLIYNTVGEVFRCQSVRDN